jgi:signal transduction histidine kinase
VSVLSGLVLDMEYFTARLRLTHLLPYFALGAFAFLAARVDKSGRVARPMAYLLGTLTTLVMIVQYLDDRTAGAGDEFVLIINITIVLLVATAAIPGWPVHMLGMGLAIVIARLALASAVPSAGPAAQLLQSSRTLHFLATATILCAALTGANYQLLLSAYRAFHESIRAQSRLLLAETAASTGRFVAAFSHEINNASGALRSAVHSLQTIASRKVNATGAELAKLEGPEAELRLLAVASVESIQETISKVQRFVNLDRAERVSVDLNALLNDVVSLAATEIPAGTSVKTDLRTLPRVTLRPQEISAVFSQLLHQACSGTPAGGTILLATRRHNSHVEIRLQEKTRVLSRIEMTAAFEPGFQVRDGRVRAGNWDLFIARQIIQAHGGEIRVESEAETGTAVSVVLPC